MEDGTTGGMNLTRATDACCNARRLPSKATIAVFLLPPLQPSGYSQPWESEKHSVLSMNGPRWLFLLELRRMQMEYRPGCYKVAGPASLMRPETDCVTIPL